MEELEEDREFTLQFPEDDYDLTIGTDLPNLLSMEDVEKEITKLENAEIFTNDFDDSLIAPLEQEVCKWLPLFSDDNYLRSFAVSHTVQYDFDVLRAFQECCGTKLAHAVVLPAAGIKRQRSESSTSRKDGSKKTKNNDKQIASKITKKSHAKEPLSSQGAPLSITVPETAYAPPATFTSKPKKNKVSQQAIFMSTEFDSVIMLSDYYETDDTFSSLSSIHVNTDWKSLLWTHLESDKSSAPIQSSNPVKVSAETTKTSGENMKGTRVEAVLSAVASEKQSSVRPTAAVVKRAQTPPPPEAPAAMHTKGMKVNSKKQFSSDVTMVRKEAFAELRPASPAMSKILMKAEKKKRNKDLKAREIRKKLALQAKARELCRQIQSNNEKKAASAKANVATAETAPDAKQQSSSRIDSSTRVPSNPSLLGRRPVMPGINVSSMPPPKLMRQGSPNTPERATAETAVRFSVVKRTYDHPFVTGCRKKFAVTRPHMSAQKHPLPILFANPGVTTAHIDQYPMVREYLCNQTAKFTKVTRQCKHTDTVLPPEDDKAPRFACREAPRQFRVPSTYRDGSKGQRKHGDGKVGLQDPIVTPTPTRKRWCTSLDEDMDTIQVEMDNQRLMWLHNVAHMYLSRQQSLYGDVANNKSDMMRMRPPPPVHLKEHGMSAFICLMRRRLDKRIDEDESGQPGRAKH